MHGFSFELRGNFDLIFFQFLDINLFFSNRSMPDEKIFGGVRVTTRSYLIRCYLIDSINRTVGNLITMG